MSKIKVNSLEGVGASTPAISIDNASGTCTANITNNLSNRNLIINGAMQVAQRGTSSSSTNGIGCVDRFHNIRAGHDEEPTQAQHALTSSDTGPYEEGFRFSYHVTNGNQSSGAGAGDYMSMRYKIENQDIANSGWNYTSASSFITFSFWVKSSVAQNFYGYLKSTDGTDQRYAYETGSLTANTWTKITKTISGNSNLQFDNNALQGLEIYLSQFWGTNYTDSGVSLNTWGAWSGGSRTPDNTATWYEADNATFELTGVQLEVGSVATDFEHRSFAVEKRLCMRYYQQYTNIVATGYASDSSNTSYHHGFTFPVEMRAAPTYSITNTGSSNGQYVTDGNNNVYISSLSGGDFQAHNMAVHYNLTGDLTNFSSAYLFGVDATAYQTTHKLSAEL
tara:strand:+ start:43 stop:1221 length:1179 start_codon:yes stop_codon:yes gene_type:complete